MISSALDVFLVPLGSDRHDLYCEVPDDMEAAEAGVRGRGLLRGLVGRFRRVLAEAEREHRRAGRRARAPRTLIRRVRDRVLRWIAEAIAEQRLLWQLRRHREARLLFPDDLPVERARAILQRMLRRDFERHRRWLVIDAAAFAASGLLAFVPGPNVVAYYFAFRVVGHYLSMRGARQGLDRVQWTVEPSRPLTDLRAALTLARDERNVRIAELARLLQLSQLPRFLDRTVLRAA